MKKNYLLKVIRKQYKKVVATTMAAVLVVSCVHVYSAYADSEDEKIKDADDSAIEASINDVIKFDTSQADKEEVVYVFADNKGNVQKNIVSDTLHNYDRVDVLEDASDLKDIVNIKGDETFDTDGENIKWNANGNDICYQGTSDKEIPVSVKVSYFLDGNEVEPEEIAGKDGNVTIRYDYTNNKKMSVEINGENEEVFVPFIVATGVILGDNFENISVINGKCISDGKNNIVVGMAMPGMKENLKLESIDDMELNIPDYFEINAKVTDFKMDMTLSVVTGMSEIGIDEIKLDKIDEVINELDSATSKLVDGSGKLADGAEQLSGGAGKLKTGLSAFIDGVKEYINGAKQINDGIGELYGSVPQLKDGIKQLKKGVDAIYENFGTKDKKTTIRGGANELKNGAIQLSEGSKQLSDGTKELVAGTTELNKGGKQLAGGAKQLDDGINQLVKAIGEMSGQIAENEKLIYQKLAASGINSYDEAVTALEQAKQLQALLINAIATNDYSIVSPYGATSAQSAAVVLNSITTKINQLQEAVTSINVMDKIATPLGEKSEDINKLVEGSRQVKEGASNLSEGIGKVDAGAKAVNKGAGDLYTGTVSLKTGIAKFGKGIEKLYKKAIKPVYGGMNELSGSIPNLEDGVKTLYDGSNKLVVNNKKISDGSIELSFGTETLCDGIEKLEKGANELSEGMKQYSEEAIDNIVNAYNGNVKDIIFRINAVINASEEYKIYSKVTDGKHASVKFIIKTEEVE